MGPVGHRFGRRDRGRRDLRVFGVPDYRCRQRCALGCHAGELAGPRSGGLRGHGRPTGADDRRLGRQSASAPPRSDRPDRAGGGFRQRDELGSREPRIPVVGVGVARGRGGLRRSGQRPLQRDAAAALDTAELRQDLRIRLDGGIHRQRRSTAGRLVRLHLG